MCAACVQTSAGPHLPAGASCPPWLGLCVAFLSCARRRWEGSCPERPAQGQPLPSEALVCCPAFHSCRHLMWNAGDCVLAASMHVGAISARLRSGRGAACLCDTGTAAARSSPGKPVLPHAHVWRCAAPPSLQGRVTLSPVLTLGCVTPFLRPLLVKGKAALSLSPNPGATPSATAWFPSSEPSRDPGLAGGYPRPGHILAQARPWPAPSQGHKARAGECVWWGRAARLCGRHGPAGGLLGVTKLPHGLTQSRHPWGHASSWPQPEGTQGEPVLGKAMNL